MLILSNSGFSDFLRFEGEKEGLRLSFSVPELMATKFGVWLVLHCAVSIFPLIYYLTKALLAVLQLLFGNYGQQMQHRVGHVISI